MTIPFHVWGAGLACALGGAVAGNALGSVPIIDRSMLQTYYQMHASSTATAPGRTLPDHYPLVTREGTVPVAALSERGLYSQARYKAFVYAYSGDPGPAPMPADWPADAPAKPTPERPAMAELAAAAEADPQEIVREPLELAAGPAALAEAGQARLIDVQLSLLP